VLRRAAIERTRTLVLSTLEWSDGELTFAKGKPNLDGELLVDLHFVPLLLAYARSHPPKLNDLLLSIGPPDTRPIVAVDGEKSLAGVELEPTTQTVFDRSDGSLQVTELAAKVSAPDEEVLREIYGLLLAGVLRPAEAGELSRPRGEAEQVSRDEILSRVARAAESDHYAVLGLTGDASAQAVRAAYYYLARRYHPDRFRAGDLQDLFDEIEGYFVRVTEAYNTLIDDDLRAQYDEEIASRVAGAEEPKQDTASLAKQNYARGKLLAQRRQFRDATTFLENAIQLDPSKAAYHFELGRLLTLNPRRRTEAEERLLEAARLEPTRVDSYVALSELYHKTGRNEDAIRICREALSWDPGCSEAIARLKELGQKP
jgi:curved DNA-binding protein CbpA